MKICKKYYWALLGIGLFLNVNAQNKEETIAFNFGTKASSARGLAINKAIDYDTKTGYGFDLVTAQNVNLNSKSLTADKSIYFSVKLPEGNYKVEVVLGGEKAANTTIKAESRRLMVDEVKTKAKETLTQSFVVNVRTAKFGSDSLKLKPGELSGLNWDDKLTLEFLGSSAIQSIKITPISKIKTLFIAGDSTVTDQNNEPWGFWGHFFTNFLTTDVVVANYACSGLALSSFKSGNR